MEKKNWNSNHLKWIAILAMTVDHVADLLFPGLSVHPVALIMHIIGRLTAPIMWFFICEGFHHTGNLRKYLLRMFLFAIVSHFAYCFAFGIDFLPLRTGFLNQTSVIWSLAWAIVALWILNSGRIRRPWLRYVLVLLICLITFPADWSCIAVMAIVAMYDHRGDLKKQMLWMILWVGAYCLVYFFFVDKVYALIQLGVILVWPLLKQYNGQRGKANWMKWLFYLYYPAHLAIIGLLRLLLYGNVPLLF